jgi:hypothetical protein
MTPTLYLTGTNARKHHGPGRRYNAMAHPGQYDRGNGNVPALTPHGDALPLLYELLSDRKAGRPMNPATLAEYKRLYLRGVEAVAAEFGIGPGKLWLVATGGVFPVKSGSTIVCMCAESERAAGRCHLSFAVQPLINAGWSVILDGKEVTP